ncbi:hypothetical protein TNCV_1945841 [Trichonephila clavipes]|nr:hypothetical protein TNCV_1945841 [Trichonephila clavipes]
MRRVTISDFMKSMGARKKGRMAPLQNQLDLLEDTAAEGFFMTEYMKQLSLTPRNPTPVGVRFRKTLCEENSIP